LRGYREPLLVRFWVTRWRGSTGGEGNIRMFMEVKGGPIHKKNDPVDRSRFVCRGGGTCFFWSMSFQKREEK